jgi:hypothetical protein
VLKDSPFLGPVSIANVGAYNGRVIVNLCLRTAKSGENNASISFPQEWSKASKFQAGDVVNVKIEDGYIRNIWHARPEPVRAHNISAAAVNEHIAEAIQNQHSEAVAQSAEAEVAEVVEATKGELPPF